MTTDKVYIGLEHAPLAFDLCGRVLGEGGANLEFIRTETGAMVILKGGSGDKMNPLHLAVSHSRGERLAAARALALSLVESVRQEFQQWSTQNAPATPPVNMPPPAIVNHAPANMNVNIPAPNVISSMPPPSVQMPVNVQPQPQMLQLVPQQQIFVGPDGSHYVKVTVAQTPLNSVCPMTTAPAVVNVMQQPPPVQPQHSFTAPPPTVEILSGVATPTVCAAPTLSTSTNTLGRSGVQPWSAPQQQQVQPVPAPMQIASVLPSNVPAWQSQALAQQVRPWSEPKSAVQQPTNQANLPWYKNSQNVSSSLQQNKFDDTRQLRPVEVWNEGSSQNNAGSGKPPVWETGSGNPKAAMPDLLEEINQDDEKEFGDNTKSRDSRGRDYGRERKRDSGRPDSRRERRRRYTDAEVYQKQFRSAGVLGDERAGDEKSKDGELKDLQEQQLNRNDKPRRESRGQDQRGTDWYQGGHAQTNTGPSVHISKWDRPAANQSPTKVSTPQYNAPNYYQQQQNQYAQTPQQQKPSQPPQAENQDKQTPTTQYVGAPTNYTPPQQSYSWSSQASQYQQSQHPWNRNEQGNQYNAGNQYAHRPWNASPLAPPPPPPAPFQNALNNSYWPGGSYN